ncbi:MAG: hypothetical protein ABI723_12300 [Bacteroidia bacterium]
MTDKRRYSILTVSIIIGSVFSIFIFKMKSGGTLTSHDWLSIGSIFLISVILLFGVSIIFKIADKNKMD